MPGKTEFEADAWWIFNSPLATLASAVSAYVGYHAIQDYRTWSGLTDNPPPGQEAAAASRRRHPHHTRNLVSMWLFVITFVFATAFHTNDNVLTERLDYFGVAAALMFMFWNNLVKFFNADRTLKIQLAVPFVLYYLYYCYSMHFVHFSYDWNTISGGLMILGSLLTQWAIIYYYRPPYAHLYFKSQLLLICCLQFEIFELKWWYYLDGHSLWHASQCLIFPYSVVVIKGEVDAWVKSEKTLLRK